MKKITERQFEDHIEWWLLTHGGYSKSDPDRFDRRRGLNLDELAGFLKVTQPESWQRLVAIHGGDEAKALERFADRLASELDERGTVDVLRHGVIDHGVELKLAYFRPAHSLTPELEERYRQNRVSVCRQFAYEADSHKTIDLALLVNGIPTATAELKNPQTHQTVEHAVAQYRNDRDPANVSLARRALVHFAVDPEEVKMTTRLARADTVFLPFNRGDDGGAGNPANPVGHRTAYLWEDVWTREAWLDILARFVHVEYPTEGTRAEKRRNAKVIFPRFHQWDAVLVMVAHAKHHGAGEHYLVEHSAGSGKSNTIAWLAHRLSNLHDANDVKVFDKIVVITDRLVLDRQLQETIYQFEHAHGVVVKIDKDSTQLAEALSGEQAKIIITTLQKFPFVLSKIEDLGDRQYAVLVDEAHSSQTGEAAKDLRAALGTSNEDDALTQAEETDAAEEAAAGDPQDRLADLVKGRGRQANLSFFAFTATPKAKTLEMFGTRTVLGGEDRFVPFHLYTMRQAIEEGFILDVLEHYTTYRTYFRIEKSIFDDPEYDKSKAKAAIARFVSLHPHNLAQKAEIIVEHFRNHVAARMGGHAKAMVVTSSRLHAVRYKQAIDRYTTAKGYTDIKTLVAFSGKVIDEGDTFTESSMNTFPDTQTAQQFDSDDYQVLIVAEKFQTGFDQPLLHTMYVDKTLTGLAAVQTLSRLNRIYPGKDSTFVLDFRNDADDIRTAFAPWYEQTAAIPTDPNLMYDARRRLADYNVIRTEEIDAFIKLLVGNGKKHAGISALLDKADERFRNLDRTDQDEFREHLSRFINIYKFVSQIATFTDSQLEADYLYCRALDSQLGDQDTGRLDLGKDVKLTHLRTEKIFEGGAQVDEGDGDITAIFSGKGKEHELDPEHLSQIIELINERFGLDLDDKDQLLFDQYEQTWLDDDDLATQARANDLANFRLVFQRYFMDTIVRRMDSNEEIFKKILDDGDFRNLLFEFYLTRLFREFRTDTGPKTAK